MNKLILALLFLCACSGENSQYYQGYVEADFVNVSAEGEGVLKAVNFKKGASVSEGDILFLQDNASELLERESAAARLAVASSRLEDAKKGMRETERQVIMARLKEAEAAQKLGNNNFNRASAQIKQGSITAARYDEAKAAKDRGDALVLAIKKELEASALSQRADQLEALESEVRGAKAALDLSETLLSRRQARSPADALVYEQIHFEGEWVSRGTPVLRLLPQNSAKIRFFLPQSAAQELRVGQELYAILSQRKIACPISYISERAEYTPPLIYSVNTNHKMVFMAECAPAERELNIGQPVRVATH